MTILHSYRRHPNNWSSIVSADKPSDLQARQEPVEHWNSPQHEEEKNSGK